MDGLKRVERIGSGTFGDVYKAIDDGAIVAVKIIDGANQDIDEIQQEIRLLSRCQHPNIIRYKRTIVDRNRLWIVMDFCEMGSMRDILETMKRLPEKAVAFIGREVLQALAYLHDQGIIHRDIKSANILLTADGQVRLGDFGVSGTTDQSTRIAGSPYWMAPEVIRKSRFDAKADIWSFGVTMFELLTGNPPLWQLEPGRAMRAIAKTMPPRLDAVAGVSKEMRDLVHACLHDDPDKVPG